MESEHDVLTYEKSVARRDPVERAQDVYDEDGFARSGLDDDGRDRGGRAYAGGYDEHEQKSGDEDEDADYARSQQYDQEDPRYEEGDDLDGYAEGGIGPITPSATKSRGKIKDYVTPSIENLKRFAKLINTSVQCHQREQIKGSEITRLLSENASFERKSTGLAAVWAEFASSYRKLEHERTVILRYLDTNIAKQIPILMFDQKEHKVSLNKRNRHVDKLNRRELGADNATGLMRDRAQNKVHETQQKAEQSHHDFHYSSLELETDRMTKLKEMLRTFAKSHLYFYTRQLQYWAKVKKRLSEMDSEADAANLFAAMKTLDYHGSKHNRGFELY
jgi:hypothetical protein